VGIRGLKNIGNTCFLNSTLQTLVHAPPLLKYYGILNDDSTINVVEDLTPPHHDKNESHPENNSRNENSILSKENTNSHQKSNDNISKELNSTPLKETTENTNSQNKVIETSPDIEIVGKSNGEKEGPLTKTFRFFFRSMWSSNQLGSNLNPKPILARINETTGKFAGGRQQDSHEFLRYFLDAMINECQKSGPDNIFIEDMFKGDLVSNVICHYCYNKSTVHEKCLDLSLPIPFKYIDEFKRKPGKKGRNNQHWQDSNNNQTQKNKSINKPNTTS